MLDMETEGTWIHNGVATGAAANKRAEATLDTSNTVVYGLSKTEANSIDDDANGADDEDYGPAGRTGDYRFGLPDRDERSTSISTATTPRARYRTS